MHCHVFVPGFAWRNGNVGELCSGLSLEAIETIVAKGRRTRSPGLATERWLLERFGVERQLDWPAAPFSLLADGGSPGDGVWVRADPVHLRLERDDLVLADCNLFRISREESEALVQSLNEHLNERLVIYPLRPERWHARLVDRPEIETTPLSAARGSAIDGHLLRGGDSARWHALVNELQMLLHEHPVNAEREARGELPINSVWFWGAGHLQQPSTRAFQYVAADDPLALGLAQAAGAQAQSLPADGGTWLAGAGDIGVALLYLDWLAPAQRYGDAQRWRVGLARLEQAWLIPLLAALRNGRIGMLTLYLAGEEQLLRVEATRSDLRYFWRRSRPIEHWLS